MLNGLDDDHPDRGEAAAPSRRDAAPVRNVLAVVRGHTGQEARLDALAAEIAAGHDAVVIVADETNGPVAATAAPVRPHTLDSLAAMGLKIIEPKNRALWYLGDYALYGSLIDEPHDFFFVVEYDVGLARPGDGYWAELFALMRGGALDGIDFVGIHYGPYRKTFFRHPYAEPYKGLFALVGLSRRALHHLYRKRLREAKMAVPDRHGATHCEVFVPSVLHRDGFAGIDLNDLLPGSYDRAGVNSVYVTPLGHEDLAGTKGRLLHRVASLQSYLTRGAHLAARHGWVSTYAHQLERLRARGVDPAALDAARATAEKVAAGIIAHRARLAARGGAKA